ncbi:MAG: hypothetical protein ACPGUC_03730 [Gammaproteobacteria bacterium]
MIGRINRGLTPWLGWIVPAVLVAGVVTVLAGFVAYQNRSLGVHSEWSGYVLMAVFLSLAAFNVRKRLPAPPLVSARTWLRLHVSLGVGGFFIFLLHTGSLWPTGLYEQVLALLVYIVSLSGLLGMLLQLYVPRRLAQIPEEFIYERIPTLVAEMREQAEAQVLVATCRDQGDTLGRYYLETLAWFFQRPRFALSHVLGDRKGQAWLETRIAAISQYLNDEGREHLARIHAIGVRKNDLDAHYALQRLLKLWLFIHVPLATGLLFLGVWHWLVVNIYVL